MHRAGSRSAASRRLCGQRPVVAVTERGERAGQWSGTFQLEVHVAECHGS